MLFYTLKLHLCERIWAVHLEALDAKGRARVVIDRGRAHCTTGCMPGCAWSALSCGASEDDYMWFRALSVQQAIAAGKQATVLSSLLMANVQQITASVQQYFPANKPTLGAAKQNSISAC